MAAIEDMLSWSGRTMVDVSGDKIGTISDIYVEDEADEPVFALVDTGLFGTQSTFVPLEGAERRNEEVSVPYQKERVKDAPRAGRDDALTPEQEAELYTYYGIAYVSGTNRLRRNGPLG
jgi:hypothetical protein